MKFEREWELLKKMVNGGISDAEENIWMKSIERMEKKRMRKNSVIISIYYQSRDLLAEDILALAGILPIACKFNRPNK